MLNNEAIAGKLETIGVLLELKGENPFRTKAYYAAAQTIRNLPDDIQKYIENDELTSLKGIGKDLAEKIKELATTGETRILSELKNMFPPELLELLNIQGLGPKKVKTLYEELKIYSIDQLKEACEKHLIRTLKGFGAKTEENIIAGIQLLRSSSGKFLISEATHIAHNLLDSINKCKNVIESSIAGSLRRQKEIVRDIDILVSINNSDVESIFKQLSNNLLIKSTLSKGSTKLSFILQNNMQCDVRIVKPEEYPFALQYFTGSKEHNVELRSRAKRLNYSLNEYGLQLLDHSQKAVIPTCKTESDIYQALNLQYIPPELREHNGEFEAAEKFNLPALIEINDIKGALHCHTTYSDGSMTIEELIASTKQLGWSFVGIADHSKAAQYAGGMSIDTALEQLQHIDKIKQQSNDVHIFSGIECDILSDGSLDYPDNILQRYDYVIVSVHNKMKMTEEEATKRIIKALKNKNTTILGHPTGRLLLEREGYPLDIKTIIDVAADYGKLIEINANPKRLDLDWRWLRYAKEKGVIVCINPDAHHPKSLLDVYYGVSIARKGWLEKENVLNTWNISAIKELFKKH